MYNNPNTIKAYKILQKLSPKHAAHGVAQSTYPIYKHGKACLSKQPPWRAAGDPRLARGRSRVRAPGPAGALRALFSPPSLPSSFGRKKQNKTKQKQKKPQKTNKKKKQKKKNKNKNKTKQNKKRIYQVRFLFGVTPGVDSYSLHFGTINK